MNSRDRMLEAAICAIEAHGEAGVRVDEISSAAEVAKPSLYHFFGSREGLIAAAQAERYRRSLNIGLEGVVEIAEACESSEEFERLVRSWVESFASDAAGHRRAVRLSVLGSSVSRPDLQAEIVRTSEAASSQLRNLLTLGDRFGHRLTMHLGQLGLVVKRLQMRHPTGHVQPYNPLGPRRMMQRLEDTRQAARAIETHRPILSTQKRPQCHGPKTDPRTLQKRPPSDPIDS